jgi:hypothetical protein
MVFSQIRDYLSEVRKTVTTEWKLFQKFGSTTLSPDSEHPDIDLRRLQQGFRQTDVEHALTTEYTSHQQDTYYGYLESDHMKGQPFEFFIDADPALFPQSRQPAPGITLLPYRFHPQQVVTATQDVPETGFTIHPLLRYLLTCKYPEYLPHIYKLCRPLGTTDATFTDFNREQVEYPPIDPTLTRRIVKIVAKLLNATMFLPLHYIDTFFAKMPLHTGTSYFYRHSYELKTHAAFSHPKLYSSKPSSKGYMINAFTEWARTVIHRIKEYGIPFSPENLTPPEITSRLRTFFLEHATLLFTRNHISDRDGTLKQRPVYAMDTLFLHLEAMVTFPLHIMARSVKSSIMYSLETIRGGCAYMDFKSTHFSSFLCLDWSSFDQRMPWIIVETFFTVFLPMLLIISQGYAPTAEYPTYPDLTSEKMFSRLFNIISFLRLWYYNCVFCTADGYAYVRRFAGIASGMLNTQYLDSYCNLFLMVYALISFDCDEDQIFQLLIFVMGDDNVILSLWSDDKLHSFMLFFESLALTRFGMVLSAKKSIFTILRSRIEMLGFRINFGKPQRPVSKLVAQLCYPEHGPIDKYMSSRAVGMAWASAGQDPTFHEFCYDVWHTFEPYRVRSETPDLQKVIKHLPGIFKMLDDPSEYVNPERFPSLDEVRARYATWQGELDPHTKWSPAHFLQESDFVPPFPVTMEQFMSEHGINFPAVTPLF